MRESGHKHWSSYCNKHPYEWNNYKTLAILRNPVQRFLSCYNYARMDYSYWHSIDLSQSSIYGKHPDYDICKKHEINELIYLWTEGELLLSHPGWGTQQAWILDNALVSVKYIAFFDKLDELESNRKENLYEAILDFQGRERRFGKTGRQIQATEEPSS